MNRPLAPPHPGRFPASPGKNRRQLLPTVLRHYLLVHYNLADLREIAARLGIDCEQIGGDNKKATGLDMAAFVVRERLALTHQSNRLYDVWAGDRHLIAKEYLQPDELAVAPARELNALQRLAGLDVAPQPVF
ncbi:MAG: hypothetical protein IPM39_08795 [Chloroflexi bacterium]|nr:hypothetical protein [Chloroflexota bacterium]